MTDKSIYGATQEEWDCAVALFGDAVLPSVCDPTTPVSANSSLSSALKVPSLISSDGKAYGFKAWQTHRATPKDIARWSSDDRLGICAVARDIQAIDCDSSTPELTAFVVDYFCINIGNLPLRVGKAGRGTILVRVDSPEPLPKSKITLRNDGGIVEFLSSRQHTMLFGRHSSGSRYYWPEGLPTSVPSVSLKEFNSLWQALSDHLGTGEQLTTHAANERALGTALNVLDPFAQVLRDAGIVRAENGDRLYIECPWSHEHSGPSGISSSTYMLATTTQPANYKCLHAHCADKNIVHVHRLFDFKTDDFSDVALVEPKKVDLSWTADPRWVRKSNKDKEPIIDAKVFSNVQLALEYPQLCDGLKIQYDTFSGTTTAWDTSAGEDGSGYSSLTDGDVTRIKNALNDNPLLKMQMSDKELSAQITVFQDTHGVDCALNALENIAPWDGTPRLHNFSTKVMGTDRTQYASDVGTYIFLAIVARIYLTDVSIDAIPVLIGAQKSRKSRLVKSLSLVPTHYAKIDFKATDADKVRVMAGRSVINWDELSGVNRSDLSAIKTFITETKDTIVPKYSNRAVDIIRRSVIIATTNDQRFLKDPTGNRRFFPLNVGVISENSLNQMRADKEQYYAEALHRLKENPACIHELYNHIDESVGASIARRKSLDISDDHKSVIDWLEMQESPTEISAVTVHKGIMPGRVLTKVKLVEIGQSLIVLGYDCIDSDTHNYKNSLQSLE